MTTNFMFICILLFLTKISTERDIFLTMRKTNSYITGNYLCFEIFEENKKDPEKPKLLTDKSAWRFEEYNVSENIILGRKSLKIDTYLNKVLVSSKNANFGIINNLNQGKIVNFKIPNSCHNSKVFESKLETNLEKNDSRVLKVLFNCLPIIGNLNPVTEIKNDVVCEFKTPEETVIVQFDLRIFSQHGLEIMKQRPFYAHENYVKNKIEYFASIFKDFKKDFNNESQIDNIPTLPINKLDPNFEKFQILSPKTDLLYNVLNNQLKTMHAITQTRIQRNLDIQLRQYRYKYRLRI